MTDWPLSYKLRLRAGELESLAASIHPHKPDGTEKAKTGIGRKIVLATVFGATVKIHSIALREELRGLERGTANRIERKAVHRQGIELAFRVEQVARTMTFSEEGRLKAAVELQDISERLVEFAGVVENMEGAE